MPLTHGISRIWAPTITGSAAWPVGGTNTQAVSATPDFPTSRLISCMAQPPPTSPVTVEHADPFTIGHFARQAGLSQQQKRSGAWVRRGPEVGNEGGSQPTRRRGKVGRIEMAPSLAPRAPDHPRRWHTDCWWSGMPRPDYALPDLDSCSCCPTYGGRRTDDRKPSGNRRHGLE